MLIQSSGIAPFHTLVNSYQAYERADKAKYEPFHSLTPSSDANSKGTISNDFLTDGDKG